MHFISSVTHSPRRLPWQMQAKVHRLTFHGQFMNCVNHMVTCTFLVLHGSQFSWPWYSFLQQSNNFVIKFSRFCKVSPDFPECCPLECSRYIATTVKYFRLSITRKFGLLSPWIRDTKISKRNQTNKCACDIKQRVNNSRQDVWVLFLFLPPSWGQRPGRNGW